MNGVDTIIAGILAYHLWTGFKRGLILSIFDLVGAILAVTLAFKTFPAFAPFFTKILHLPVFLNFFISFVLIWIVVFSMVQLVGWTLHEIWNRSFLSPINWFGGAVMGFMRGWILALFIFWPLFSIQALPTPFKWSLHKSVLLQWSSPWVEQQLPALKRWYSNWDMRSIKF